MSSTRTFTCEDLFHFNAINLDKLTETFNLAFYLQYLSKWPDMCCVVEDHNKQLMGYMIGKAESKGGKADVNDPSWHGHVTAVTVAPQFRRLGLAQHLMEWLEEISDVVRNGFFVDLFVRVGNHVAVSMYEKFGYITYRKVIGYYSNDEDGLDMHKALPRDKLKESMIPFPRDVSPEEADF